MGYISVLTGIIGLFLGAVAVFLFFSLKRREYTQEILQAKKASEKIIKDAQKEIELQRKTAILEAKDEWHKTKKSQENEIKERQKELRVMEKKYNDRMASLDKRFEGLDKKEFNLQESENKIKNLKQEIEKEKTDLDLILKKQSDKLSEIAQLSREEATEILKRNLIDEARNHANNEARKAIEQCKLEAASQSAQIISTAIQRMAVDYVSESTVSVVSLPGDEMKGRIIGREGRNIRSFEKASGVDLIIDDTPEAVVLSCFDPVRREVARLSLERLILDGRIHPGRIEDVIEKTRIEIEDQLYKIGEEACIELNIINLNSNLVKLIGRLHYRTSYGQNVLQHSKESAWICGIMAAELGIDQILARRAGFLHDIGKAIDHEFDGSHAVLGANMAKKNGEKAIIVNAIESHHEEVPATSVYGPLVQAADAISGARPGARREVLESYMQRLEKLEEIANGIEGVSKSYAIQAGREIRIIVDPVSIDDSQSSFIASDIAKKIEDEMQYPGQIKVTVIRETRQIAMAK